MYNSVELHSHLKLLCLSLNNLIVMYFSEFSSFFFHMGLV